MAPTAALQRHADQHRHQHSWQADPPLRQPRRGLHRDHPGRQDRLRHHCGTRGTLTPISTATNTPGNPIKIPADPTIGGAYAGQLAITPDGKTAYVLSNHTHSVIPISTATNKAGQPIRFGSDCHAQPLVWPGLSIAITPDGKTAYFACESAVVPINTATNTAGNPIPIPLRDPITIAITP